MHRIVKAHLDSFVASFGLGAEPEAAQFEKFANYSIISSRLSANYDLDDITTGEHDDGMDGVAVIVDEEITVSEEDGKSIFSTDKRNHDVEVMFIQTKRSESFDLGDFLKFKEAVLRFVNSDSYDVKDEVQRAARDVFDVVMQSVPKIRNGKPSLVARYVTTGIYRAPEALGWDISHRKSLEDTWRSYGQAQHHKLSGPPL